MSLVCTLTSPICHSCVLVCHLNVTRLWFYHEHVINENNNMTRKLGIGGPCYIPANICWSSRHVLKTSSTRLQLNNFTSFKMSWRRLEDVLKTFWRRLEDILQDVLKTSWRYVLKMSWKNILKTLWRQTKYLLGISVSNKSKCVFNKSIFHKSISDNSKTNPKCIN